jgi:hypothetical protein
MKSTAALDQCIALLEIDVLEPIEVDLAVAGIVDVGGDGEGLVGRADRAGDEAGAAVLCSASSAARRAIEAEAWLMLATRLSAP